ncbi:MAG: beta-propeller fold lactonase family protein [Syntrophomonas sp.]
MTNAAIRNEVVAFRRGHNGTLTLMNTYETGGGGTGEHIVDPLGSQGSLILSHNDRFLFAVNAGSNSISSFQVSKNGKLTLVDVESSGGVMPNSITVFRNLLYVTNVGDPENNIASNITGYHVNNDGSLTHIDGSEHSLSTSNSVPACVVFSPDGRQLVVSELNTNRLSVFKVKIDGTLMGPTINNSSGEGPFGLTFLSTGVLLVAEAISNALSSYTVNDNGTLNVISTSVQNGQTATCWVVHSRLQHFAYTSNTGSGTITTYRIKNNGTLALLKIVYSTQKEIAAPIDSGVSKDGCNFYVLNGNQGSITAFCIGNDGHLIQLQVIKNTGLPTLGAQGLAVR